MNDYIIRKHYHRGYKYYSKNNREIKLTDKLKEYIKQRYIPPAYRDVMINLHAKEDVYAIGTDDKGRKQYLYRQKHTDESSNSKFTNLVNFGKIYPNIKKDINVFLQKPRGTKEHEIGMVLKLMIDCNFRVGNNIYQKENNSFGTTTLQGRHIQSYKNGLEISFTGKKGVKNTAKIKDKRVIKSLKKMKGGRKPLFSIDSAEINQYLKKYGDFSSKDIRTWRANILFITNVCKYHDGNTKPKDTVKRASEKTAELLHHTPSISKKSYIFKELITAYLLETDKFIRYFGKKPEEQFIRFLKKNI
jgi:DNA topoisomerase-1